MLSEIIKPNKSQLVRKIQNLRNPKIETFEVIDDQSKREVSKKLDIEIRKGHFSIILIRDQ